MWKSTGSRSMFDEIQPLTYALAEREFGVVRAAPADSPYKAKKHRARSLSKPNVPYASPPYDHYYAQLLPFQSEIRKT